ncbi:MAG: Uma2 family endonuclease [Verrucomicrobia bacterium]|nr:MAG: Uma2 family endonuclease [Verrucomicrobiota bacterium]
MTASAPVAPPRAGRKRFPELLENGLHLSASEFLRLYEGMPEIKKAELINGIVYMGSPVRYDQHGQPDNLLQGWLCNYSIATPGVKAAGNTTTRLGPDDVPQPDGLLRIVTEAGGHSQVDAKGYLQGAPELVAEVAASSASIDAREKLASYRRSGACEYVLWLTEEVALNWWVLEEDEYRPLQPGPDGILRSRIFPGLWLDRAALLAEDGAKVMEKLQEGLRSSEHELFKAELRKRL